MLIGCDSKPAGPESQAQSVQKDADIQLSFDECFRASASPEASASEAEPRAQASPEAKSRSCEANWALQLALTQGKTTAFTLPVRGASDLNKDRWFIRPDGSGVCWAVRPRGPELLDVKRHDYEPGDLFGPALKVDFASASNCDKIRSALENKPKMMTKEEVEAATAGVESAGKVDLSCRGCARDEVALNAIKAGSFPVGVRVHRASPPSVDAWVIREDGSADCYAIDGANSMVRYRHAPRSVFDPDNPKRLRRNVSDYLFCRQDAPDAAARIMATGQSGKYQSVVTADIDRLQIRGNHAADPIVEVIKKGMYDVQSCHDAQLLKGGREHGKLNLSWTIALDGSVKDLSIYDSLTSNNLRECIRRGLQGMKFQKPGRVEAYVKLPIELAAVPAN